MGKYIFLALIMAAAAGLYMTRDDGFDYSEADAAARAEFIERTATRLANSDAIKQHYMAHLMRVVPNTSGKSVRIDIDLVIGFPNGRGHETTPAQRKERACRAYLASALGKVGIRTTVMLKVERRTLETLRLEQRRCERLVG